LQVLVRLLAGSVCNTDRRVLQGTKSNELTDHSRLVSGHEGGGYIVDCGPGVGFQPGIKVVVLPHACCGHCGACQSGNPNLCENLLHAGIHFDGVFSTYGVYPASVLYPVGDSYPDDLLPLIEPLSCTLRGVFRVQSQLKRLASGHVPSRVFVFGGGPIGCLLAMGVRRFHPQCEIWVVEPHPERCRVIRLLGIGDHVVTKPPDWEKADVSFAASSAVEANRCAIHSTRAGGTIVLFAGLNNDELEMSSDEARSWERIHRHELAEDFENRHLVGSSGYTRSEVRLAECELVHHARYWSTIQNVVIEGLEATEAIYLGPPKQRRLTFDRPAVEAYLAPSGIGDPNYGGEIARSLKILIRL